MLRAWRTCDFRAVFHLACKVGLNPEIIADSTGLPLALVLNVMNGNAKLSGDSNATDSIASSFGMPEDIRGVLGLVSTESNPVASIPLKRTTNSARPTPEKSEAIKLRMDVGERIAELRHERRMTQEQLADRAGISSEMVRKLEQHARTPSLAMLDAVAQALDVPASVLLEPPLAKGEPGRKKWRLPDYLPAEILSRPDFIAACEARDLGAVFDIASREGFHRSHLARRCEMTVSQVSAYIQRTRKAKDVDIFFRVSDGLQVPGAMFGIGRREWESDISSARDVTGMPPDSPSEIEFAGHEHSADTTEGPRPSEPAGSAAVYSVPKRNGLTARRKAVGYSQEQLAELLRVDRSTIGRWESGETAPQPWVRPKVAKALRISLDQLNGLLAITQPASAGIVDSPKDSTECHMILQGADTLDLEDQIIWAARKPIKADLAVVDPLTRMLAAQREAEDSIGAGPFIKPVVAQLATIENLVIDARGSARPKIMDVAAQWAEYAGWLHTSVGDASQARAWLDRACEWALEAGNTTLAATSVSFKGHLAFLLGHVGPMLGLSQAAQRDRSIWIGQLAFDAHQEALAWALMGNADAARRKTDEGAELATLTNDRFAERPPWAYYYTLPLYTAERGLVYRYLGRDDPAHNEAAITILNDALDQMGENRAAEWAGEYIYHLAFAYLQAGSSELACSSAFEILQIVRSKESAQLRERVRALCVKLAKRWPSDPHVIELDQALREAA